LARVFIDPEEEKEGARRKETTKINDFQVGFEGGRRNLPSLERKRRSLAHPMRD